jgi:DNA-binding GntR family transcriptional regulator
MMGLSKTPVREALGWLQREGLVEFAARCRYRVAPVTLKDVRDLFSLRILLEGEAMALAAGATPTELEAQALEDLGRIGYDPRDRESIANFLRVNTAFHATLARLGGNRRLAAGLEQVLDQSERLFHLACPLNDNSEESVQNHQALLRTILSGDSRLAREMTVAHVQASQVTVIEGLLSSEALQSTNISTASTRATGSRGR